jgi:hypothetical protein
MKPDIECASENVRFGSKADAKANFIKGRRFRLKGTVDLIPLCLMALDCMTQCPLPMSLCTEPGHVESAPIRSS